MNVLTLYQTKMSANKINTVKLYCVSERHTLIGVMINFCS